MTALRVLKAGICSTIQDAGRPGYRALGVPASGALDGTAFALANVLVGNPESEAAIEMLYSGLAVALEDGSVRIACGGAECTIERKQSGASERLPPWQSARLGDGDILRVGHVQHTAAAYLAIEGGLEVRAVLGSASTYLRGALGGHQGRALKVGDILAPRAARPTAREERHYTRTPKLVAPATLRVLPGPQRERFEPASWETLLSTTYTVSTSADRSGLRLEGEPLRHVGGFDLMSEGVAPGSIQVPGSGLPVILIADHPTVGGYPKIATIISADLAAAGRLRIGSRVKFELVDENGARKAREAETGWVGDVIASMASVPRDV